MLTGEQKNIASGIRYQKRRLAGICVQCGRMPARKLACCSCCRDHMKQRRKKQKPCPEMHRNFYWRRRDAGLCVVCAEPAVAARCEFCYARYKKMRFARNWKVKYDRLYRENNRLACGQSGSINSGKQGEK